MKTPEFISELSANHLGDISIAEATIRAAAYSGANAVKFQTFTPEQMVGDTEFVLHDGEWRGKKLIELYKEAHTPREWHEHLFDEVRKFGMSPLSTPFHPDDVEFLESIGCDRYKIASFEINYYDLIAEIAKTGKPIIMSTGMASLHEITEAYHKILATNPDADITLLKCTSAYPAAVEDANIETMQHMHSYFNCNVGVSDHTLSDDVAIAATLLGASVIEKHFTLSRDAGGPDAAFSMEPGEFLSMVTKCASVASAVGDVVYGPTESQTSSMKLRRSLWFSQDIKKGTKITEEHIKVARPFYEVDAKYYGGVLGEEVTRDVKAGEPVTFRLVNL